MTGEGRAAILRELGAPDGSIEELLAYTENAFDASRFEGLTFPLADEPHLRVWREYEAASRSSDPITALSRFLVQLQFPIEEGISQRDDYRAATRRGILPSVPHPPAMKNAAAIELRIHDTIAGALPVLIVSEREDFESLVQIFSSRNEPESVPASMGACIVTGLNNWDRVNRYRREWEEKNPGSGDGAWNEEFSRFATRKELYQDRFLILSCGAYSAVPAREAGFGDREWRELSVQIRMEHECTHYFTYRVLGSMRNNLLDELIADYAGLVRTFGRYRAPLALRFFGLENFPDYRSGGRLENYRGSPPLSEDAFLVLQKLVARAVSNIAAVEEKMPVDASDRSALAARIVAMASSTLEVLASSAQSVRELLAR